MSPARWREAVWGKGSGLNKLAGDAIHPCGNTSEVVHTKLIIAPVVALGLSLIGIGIVTQSDAGASAEPKAGMAGPTVSIKDFMYNPAEITANVGQSITIANNDGFSHTVTAKDGTFDLDVPANGSVTLTVSKAGRFPYSCTYHPGQHNPATITVS
jgi:plastocyanin